MPSKKLLLVSENLSSNSVGRAYCLWLLAKQLGHDVRVVSFHGDRLWQPLAGTDFANDCTRIALGSHTSVWTDADLIIACKPLPESLGLAWAVPRSRRAPLGVDVDDPDLEYRISIDDPLKQLAKSVLRPRQTLAFRGLRRIAQSIPSIVSNPWLQSRYGGEIVPHVRVDPGAGQLHRSDSPRVAFIGSNKPHKGVPVLRDAIEAVQDRGFNLVITDHPPSDAKQWEDWVGPTSLTEGLRLLAQSDIAVIASSNIADARGQLPAKLIDAMLAGRAVIVSDVPAAPWGLANAGRVVPADNVDELIIALQEFRSPANRQRAGDAARAVALERYTVDAAVDAFDRFCNVIIEESR